jgi:hypothetical protein
MSKNKSAKKWKLIPNEIRRYDKKRGKKEKEQRMNFFLANG